MMRKLRGLRGYWLSRQQAVGKWLLDYHRQHDSTVKRLIVLAWIAVIGMPLYYFVWARWFPQQYENFGLRLFGIALCLPAVFAKRLASKRWLPVYCFVGLTYVLPFFFTFMFLMNDGSPVWSQSLLIALIILFHFDTGMAFLAYLTGSGIAYLAFALHQDGGLPLDAHVMEQWPIQIFAILTVSLAKIGRKVLAQEKLAGMATALATVSHELRTPLSSIAANVRGMKRLQQNEGRASPRDKEAIAQALARVDFEVRHMNSVINLFLLSASTSNQNLQPREILSMAEMVDSALARYPFVSPEQRDLIAVTVRADFRLHGQAELCAMVLLNLLRNSLKAIHRAGKGRVRIIVDGTHGKPRLLFIDTGCGIDMARSPHIFKRFYAYPKHDGTGIGLAFCKDVLQAWNGAIRCVTRLNAYTIFVLEFPPVAAPSLVN